MPRPETKQDILKRGLALCPELASPDIRVERKPTIDDVLPLIISEGCGLRPARKGGIRLEVEWTEGIGGRGRVLKEKTIKSKDEKRELRCRAIRRDNAST